MASSATEAAHAIDAPAGSAPRRSREGLLVVGAVLVTVVLWASAFVVIRFAGRQFSPGPLALARLLVGSVALGAVMVLRRERPPTGRSFRLAVLCGLLWFGVYNVALNAAERRIDAGTASLLVNMGPIFIALLAGVVLREGFPPALLRGCAVAFAGAALIAVAVSRHGLHDLWGAVLCVVAALAYAIGVVAQKPALRGASALSVTWLACTVAALACLGFAPSLIGQLGHARGSSVAWTVYLGIGPTAVGFGLWAFALARSDAGRLGVGTYLVPPLGSYSAGCFWRRRRRSWRCPAACCASPGSGSRAAAEPRRPRPAPAP